MELKLERQRKIETIYRIVLGALFATVAVGLLIIFFQTYTLNTRINQQVDQIRQAQKQNRSINDAQNSIILGYLICIGTIKPEDRTPAIINNCVSKAKKTDITSQH